MRAWTEDMGEISGFGGSYEAGCRAMVLAGIQWLDEHPEANPQFRGWEGIYGLVQEDNADAVALTKACMDAEVTHPDMQGGEPFRAGSQATGAMHHASVLHCLKYRELGWDEYSKQLRERKA